MSDYMTEITEAKEIIEAWNVLGIAEDMENGWERDVMISVVKLFFSFITTIESLQEMKRYSEEVLDNWDNLLTEKDALIESQKEEIKRQREAIEESFEWISPSSYAYELLKNSIKEGDK